MTQRPKIFDVLRKCRDLAADEALVAGLLRVPPEQQHEIVRILIERGNEPGLIALPEIFHKLDHDSRTMILASTAVLFGSLRANIRSPQGQSRLNTLEIIRHSGCLQLGYLVAFALHDGSERVRSEAAQVLRQLTDKHWRGYEETTALLRDAAEADGSLSHAVVQTLKLLREERMHLVATVRDALNTFESHHRAEVVEAAMTLADELEETLFQQNTRKLGKLTLAMQEVFTDSLSPRLAPFVYIALSYPELRKRIITALAGCRDGAFFAEFIRFHWLTRDPAVRKTMVAIRHLNWLSDGLDAAFSLPADAAALAPGWLLSLGLPLDRKVSLLLSFLLIDNLPVNRAAVWALTRINTPASTLALQSVLDHEEPSLVQIAQREIEHRGRVERKLGHKPRTDRPEAWTSLLERAGVAEDFDDLWHNFDRLHPVQARSAGHFALKYVPGFMTQAQIKLLSPQPVDRLRALNLLIALHVLEMFQKEIFATANDPVPEVRAVAMTALGRIGEATSRRILERAVNDENPAVQAAAIDALDLMAARPRIDLILPKATNDHPEVRGAAIRALLKMQVPEGATALVRMLQDVRPEHRCGALWVADQLRLVALAPRIRDLEKTDRDPRIARIALHVCKRLDRLQNAGHSTAQSVQPAAGATAPVPVTP